MFDRLLFPGEAFGRLLKKVKELETHRAMAHLFFRRRAWNIYETQLYFGLELEFIKQNQLDELGTEITEIQKMLYARIIKFENPNWLSLESYV